MNATPHTADPGPRRPRRRGYLALAIVVLLLLAVAGLVAAWLFFFAGEAPPAPTLDDALKVLLPSASP